MPNNSFYTIENPTGVFMMMNEDDEVLTLCTDCMVASETKHGHVTNKTDCKHAEELKVKLK